MSTPIQLGVARSVVLPSTPSTAEAQGKQQDLTPASCRQMDAMDAADPSTAAPGFPKLSGLEAFAHVAQVGPVGASPGRRDGPSVFREIVPATVLEQDPRLRGKLTPPKDAAPPEGVQIHKNADGLSVLTVNIRMGVSGERSFDPSNESISALRDIARYINAVDPDVVMLQEVRGRSGEPGQTGLPSPTSILFHLVEGTDFAFTPAKESAPGEGNERYYGTAVCTRNGFTLEAAVNAALPNPEPEKEERSVGVVVVRSPVENAKPVTVLSTHLHNIEMVDYVATRPEKDQAIRDAQLTAIANIVEQLRRDGSFSYRDALTKERLRATGFPGGQLIVGGDLNQKQSETDRVFGAWGLTHASDVLLASDDPSRIERGESSSKAFTAEFGLGGVPHRIDHLYESGMNVVDVAVSSVPTVEFEGPTRSNNGVIIGSTDHCGVLGRFSAR